MDPDKCLETCRALARRILQEADLERIHTDKGERLAELFQGLDEWLTKGGFPPEDWKQ